MLPGTAEKNVPTGAFNVTNRDVLKVAIPMTLAYLSTPLVGLLDTAIIGQLGDPVLIGSIAVGAIIFDIIFTTFNFLRSGTTGLTAQAVGAHDNSERDAILWRSMLIGIVSGLSMVLLQQIVLFAGLKTMGASEAVEEATRIYFLIRVLSAPATLINYAILGWLLGLGRAFSGLMLQLFLNCVNIGVSAWLVLGLNWGIEGVAWGSVVAETAAAVFGLAYVLFLQRKSIPKIHAIFQMSRFKSMLSLNMDIMIRSFALLFAFYFFTSQGARSGDVILAANAVLMNLFIVGGYFLDGFATAAEQLGGRAIGARWRPAFERTVKLTLVWGFILAAILTSIYLIFGTWLIDLISKSDDVRLVARDYLFWAALTPLIGVMAFQMDGIYIGATWSKDMRKMMLLSVAVYLLAWWILTPLFANHGLWAALCIFLGVRGIALYWRLPTKMHQAFGASV